jgi:ubiquinone/menaquinone biosynthesis C-methylase UbiE
MLDLRNDSRVLDVGGGQAKDTIALAENIGREGCVVGVDNDSKMVEVANHELELSGIKKNVKHI